MSKPKKKVRLMPAIREESHLSTNRIPVHIIPPGSKPGPFRQSMIIQNLPDDPHHRPKPPPPKIGPMNQISNSEQSALDRVVSDYLNYSSYGPTIPAQSFTQGFAPAACPCCMDRNRENLQRLQDRHRAPPPEPDLDSLLEPVLNKHDPVVSSTDASPRRNMNNVGFSDTVDVQQISPREKTRKVYPATWAEYQPQPYYAYFSPEFNRYTLLEGYEDDRRRYEQASQSYVSGQVIDANTKYDLAMKKLERTMHRLESSASRSRENSDYM